MKHATSGIVGLIVAAGFSASCGSLAVNGTGSASEDAAGPDASLRCGASGEACCDQNTCNDGLQCAAGTCAGASHPIDATPGEPKDVVVIQDDVVAMDAPGPVPTDASMSADVGDSQTAESGEAGEAGVPDAQSSDAADAADARAEASPAVCVATGAACTTTNPGACGPGTSACDDAGTSVCVPVQSTQDCYTGPAGTQGVGTCTSGTQSCIGSLGTCDGEVVPAAVDDCFTATDNDCDGTVGNGCPQALTLGPDRPLPVVGGNGGAMSIVHCPLGAFVTRVDSWFDDVPQHAAGVSIFCAAPTLVQGASSYSVTLTASAPAPYQTAAGPVMAATNERTDDCGTTGLSAITYTTGLADNFIEGIGNHCGTSALTLAADNTIPINFVPSGDTSYNAWSNSPGTFFNEGCNSDEVIVGFTLRIGGTGLVSIRPICAALSVTYQ
jgi:hypothetical protein